MKRKTAASLLAGLMSAVMIMNIVGCSSSDSSSNSKSKNKDRDGKVEDDDDERETTKKELSVPSSLTYEYNADLSKIVVSWKGVSGAAEYEVELNGRSLGTTNNTSCDITNVNQGDDGIIKVRAVDGDIKSEWASVDYEIAYYLDPVTTFDTTINGVYDVVYWVPVEGADGYALTTSKGDYDLTSPYISMYIDAPGTNESIQIRPYKDVNGKRYYGDERSMNFAYPTTDLSEINMYESVVLDYDSLINWINAKGYTYQAYDSNGYTFVIVSMEDPLNSGWLNGLARFGGTLLGTSVSSIPSALKDNLAGALLGGSSLEEYIDSSAQDAALNGLFAAFGAAFMDTSINLVYRYNNPNCVPNYLEIYMLQDNRPNISSIVGDSQPRDDGYYHFYASSTGSDTQDYAEKIWTDSGYWVIHEFRTDNNSDSPMYFLG